MDVSSNSVTSATLLFRLGQSPLDDAAWEEFVARYGRQIVSWCRQWGLQEADAQDISQTVLLKLLRAAQTFRYDPQQKFRAWLKTIAHHAWQDLVRSRRQAARFGAGAQEDSLQQIAARDDFAQRIEAAFEQELLDEAILRVQPRVQKQTWEAFRLTTYEGLSGAEAAGRLGMAITNVYKAKSNIRKLLEVEVRSLEGA
jgi:RNA polymerase sigma-70 factor (ECF subfamily)